MTENKKSKSKILTGVLAVSLAAALLIGGGAFSYLHSSTEEDTVNEFNPNLVNVKISESGDGQYQIIPGTAQAKDPKVTLKASVDSYVYLYVTDTTEGFVEYQIDTNTWTEIDNSDGEWDYVLTDKGYSSETTKIYYTKAEVTETGASQELTYEVLVGNSVSYKSSLENGNMVDENGNLREGLALTFSAEAVQAEGFADYEEALDAIHGGVRAIEAAKAAQEAQAAQAGYSWDLSTDNENNIYTASITGYSGSDTELTIPSQIYDKDTDGNYHFYTVTYISDRAFLNNTLITSVTIPSGVTSIGEYAFYENTSITSVIIPDSVTSIDKCAFSGCSSLTSIDLPNGLTSIGMYAFYGCSSLTSITIPDSVTSIGNWAFYRCSSLTSITIPNSVTSIGNYAFYKCSGLKSITIPNSVTGIGDGAFSDCSSLTSITIPDSVTSIGDSAFTSCVSLTSITIPDSVTSIGEYAFDKCSSLESITIPNSVTSIEDYVFRGCSSLTSITIPDSVTSIGKSAFIDCISLTSITIPNSVTSIGDGAFEGIEGILVDVYYTGTEDEWDNISIGSNNSCLTTIHYNYNPDDNAN